MHAAEHRGQPGGRLCAAPGDQQYRRRRHPRRGARGLSGGHAGPAGRDLHRGRRGHLAAEQADDRHLPQRHTGHPQRPVRQGGIAAPALPRQRDHRRPDEPLHQRRGQHRHDAGPVADEHGFRHHQPGGHAGDDDLHQHLADADHAGVHSDLRLRRPVHHQQEPQVLFRPAGGPGRGQRLHRGIRGRAEGGQGVQPRGRLRAGVQPAEQRPAPQADERHVLRRHHGPHHGQHHPDQLCPHRGHRRRAVRRGAVRRGRPGDIRELRPPVLPPHQRDLPADGHHILRPGRRGARVHADGQGARGPRRRGRRRAGEDRGPRGAGRRQLRLCARQDRAQAHQPVRQARPEDRLRRLHRRGQDHHHQPAEPLL